jgi:hypothetical protein
MDARTKGASAWSADIRITICLCFNIALQFLFFFLFGFILFYGRTTSKIPLKFILFLHVEVSVMISISLLLHRVFLQDSRVRSCR